MPKCPTCRQSARQIDLRKTGKELACVSCIPTLTKVPSKKKDVVTINLVETEEDGRKDYSVAFNVRAHGLSVSGEYPIEQIVRLFSGRSKKKLHLVGKEPCLR